MQRTQLRSTASLFASALVVAGLVSGAVQRTSTPTRGHLDPESLGARVQALEHKLQHVTRDGSDYVFSGTRIVVRNGAGASTTDGKGNLVVGFQAKPEGSHNLIAGELSSARSYGGVVAGRSNTVTGPRSSAYGGTGHAVGGEGACVTGGVGNRASGVRATVSGGVGNTASGLQSSVLGGHQNSATSPLAVIRGGSNGQANEGQLASVSGGLGNIARGEGMVVCGGHDCWVPLPWGAVAARSSYVPSSPWPENVLIAGGDAIVTGTNSVAVGGHDAHCSGQTNTIVGGLDAFISSSAGRSTVVGGNGNQVSGVDSGTVTGGRACRAWGEDSTVSGGAQRTVTITDSWAAGGLFEAN